MITRNDLLKLEDYPTPVSELKKQMSIQLDKQDTDRHMMKAITHLMPVRTASDNLYGMIINTLYEIPT